MVGGPNSILFIGFCYSDAIERDRSSYWSFMTPLFAAVTVLVVGRQAGMTLGLRIALISLTVVLMLEISVGIFAA